MEEGEMFLNGEMTADLPDWSSDMPPGWEENGRQDLALHPFREYQDGLRMRETLRSAFERRILSCK